MRIIKEYSYKIIIITFSCSLIFEALIFIKTLRNYSYGFSNSYWIALDKAKQKAVLATQKLNQYAENTVRQYITDLKLIGRHMSLLNGKFSGINKNEDIINPNINFPKNNIKILKGVLAELIKDENLKSIYNESKNEFDYINNLEKKFKNINDKKIIINDIYKYHQELDTVSYYKGENTIENSMSDEDMKSVKFLISILKKLYIRRYILKLQNFGVYRFIILYDSEIYIYPPEQYNNTNSYNFPNVNPYFRYICNYASNNIELLFPKCVYNYCNIVIYDPSSVTTEIFAVPTKKFLN